MAEQIASDRSDLEEQQLVERIAASESDFQTVSTTLQTDEQVIARITDGIYRQPGSALSLFPVKSIARCAEV
jgi:hypothetical protein